MTDTATLQVPADSEVGEPRGRHFRLLMTGSSISMLGSRITTIAYPLLVLAVTGSPVLAGWACFAATAPSVLFYLPAGALVDRCNPRSAMLTCESIRGVVITTVVIDLLAFHLNVALLISAAVAEEILEVFSTLAERRLARSLTDPDKAASTLAQAEARTHMAIMIGRPLGALLFSISRALPFIADSLSFCTSVCALLRIGKTPQDNSFQRAPKTRLIREIGDGFKWLGRHPFALSALLLTSGTTLISQALIMVFLGQAHNYRLGALTMGGILAASGIGGALGSTLAPRLFRNSGYALFKYQLTSWVVIFICLTIFGGQFFVVVAVSLTVMGFTGALGNISLDAYVIKNAEEAMLARVMSIGWLMSMIALALGPLMGGFLFKEYGAHITLMVLLAVAVLLRVAAPRTPSSQSHLPQLESG